MVFSTNQARHFFNVSTITAGHTSGVPNNSNPISAANNGTIRWTYDAAKKHLYFQYKQFDNIVRSDLIDVDKVLNLKFVSADLQKTPLKKVTVKLNSNVNSGDPVAGQDYILRITLYNYIGISEEDQYFKYGAVHATSGMGGSDFYKLMAISLAKNFSRELSQPFKFYVLVSNSPIEVTANTTKDDLTGNAEGIVIEEVEQEWHLGTFPQTRVNFKVFASEITYDGDDVLWASEEAGDIVYSDSTTELGNGKKVADLEYFCMGERGDVYRNMGWPNVIPTKYSVDPSKEYDVIEIHYTYIGANESIQKSEKDLTLVCVKGNENFKGLYTALAAIVPNATTEELKKD